MIIDTLENLSFYSNLNPFLVDACRFLHENDLNALAEGWHAVSGDGEDAYAMAARENCRNNEDADLEAHRKYIDVQICLEGVDRIGWSPLTENSQPINAYEPEDDLIFFDAMPEQWLDLAPGYFIMFFPHDLHKPLIGSGEVRKLVLKLRDVN